MGSHSCNKCASEREAPLHVCQFRGFTTQQGTFLWFDSVQTEDVRGITEEDQCASGAAGGTGSTLSLHVQKLTLVLVLAGPLIPQFCVNLCQLSKLVAPEPVVQTSLCSSALFWAETLDI